MNSIIHRKESIILTTIDLIDKYGVHQVSTREIARTQGITEGAIYKHFKSKDELFLSVLDYFAKYDSDIYQTALQKKTAEEGITFFVESLASYYQNYPSIIAIHQSMDMMRYDAALKEKVHSIQSARFDNILEIIRKGQENGEIPPEQSSEMLTDIIIGTCLQLCNRWRINNYTFSLSEKCLDAVKAIFSAFCSK